VCCLAGPIAEEIYSGIPLRALAASDNCIDIDLAMAAEALRRAACPPAMCEVAATTRRLVRGEWRRITAVATALAFRGSLDYGECLVIIDKPFA
jgi:hypothetical protein